jgi:hypothetical protein
VWYLEYLTLSAAERAEFCIHSVTAHFPESLNMKSSATQKRLVVLLTGSNKRLCSCEDVVKTTTKQETHLGSKITDTKV